MNPTEVCCPFTLSKACRDPAETDAQRNTVHTLYASPLSSTFYHLARNNSRRIVVISEPPIGDREPPADPANLRAEESQPPLDVLQRPIPTTSATTRASAAEFPSIPTSRRRGAQAERCRLHHRQSHGRRVEARQVPRSVSCLLQGLQHQPCLTMAQASQERAAPQHPH